MSLLYVIDGFNVVKHASFIPSKKSSDKHSALLEYIKSHHLCKSRKNKTIIVFDGFPDRMNPAVSQDNIEIIFSAEKTADERIKIMVEKL